MLSITARFVRPTLALAAAASAFAFGAPAMAATAEAAPSILVPLTAADLSSAGSVSKVRARIATAARKVCVAGGSSLEEQIISRQCYDNAVRSAEAQLVAQREQAKGRERTLAAAQR
ncbi:UrcA family protein [Novosphingobium sp.]|uniref:UrcA family protein n=1 Tax=Novosphingobium sp. TaxID=1874826 RepID=UPI0026118E48|nr:UrcA family protein [Novosphingobium sp.]